MTPKRILTVDDAQSVRSLVSRTLGGAGYDIVEAVDGADALDKVADGVDMVITDINMPGMGGLELLGQLRMRPDTKFTPVIVLTTSREAQDIHEVYSLGANSYIRKPVDFEQFLQAVGLLASYWLHLNEACEAPR